MGITRKQQNKGSSSEEKMPIITKVIFQFENEEGQNLQAELDMPQFEVLWKYALDWNDFWDILAKISPPWTEVVEKK